jgi:hypothetical protein
MPLSTQEINKLIEIAKNERAKMHNLRLSMNGEKINNIRKRKREDDESKGYDLASINRADKCMECIAFDTKNNFYYVGYSGRGSPVSSGPLDEEYVQDKRRRLDRIQTYVSGVKSGLGRDVSQCAEAAALSVAISWGAKFENLTFLSLNKNNNVQDPCQNCIQYIKNYINKDGKHVEPR